MPGTEIDGSTTSYYQPQCSPISSDTDGDETVSKPFTAPASRTDPGVTVKPRLRAPRMSSVAVDELNKFAQAQRLTAPGASNAEIAERAKAYLPCLSDYSVETIKNRLGQLEYNRRNQKSVFLGNPDFSALDTLFSNDAPNFRSPTSYMDEINGNLKKYGLLKEMRYGTINNRLYTFRHAVQATTVKTSVDESAEPDESHAPGRSNTDAAPEPTQKRHRGTKISSGAAAYLLDQIHANETGDQLPIPQLRARINEKHGTEFLHVNERTYHALLSHYQLKGDPTILPDSHGLGHSPDVATLNALFKGMRGATNQQLLDFVNSHLPEFCLLAPMSLHSLAQRREKYLTQHGG